LSTADKTALILQSFREINGFPQFSISATETAQVVKDAQCEFAWLVYLSPNRDRVFALHAQGVRNYSASKFSQRLENMECPEFITKMLNGFMSAKGGGSMMISRDFDQW
jgi:FAD synthase